MLLAQKMYSYEVWNFFSRHEQEMAELAEGCFGLFYMVSKKGFTQVKCAGFFM
jgi:hypothetical protein